jgi:hypothetical protein
MIGFQQMELLANSSGIALIVGVTGSPAILMKQTTE